MEVVASTPQGVANLADRTRGHVPGDTQTHPITIPTLTPNDKHPAPAPSTLCQSDMAGDGERLLTKDERDSTAEQEQLRKHRAHKGEAVMKTEHNGHALPGGGKMNSVSGQDTRGRTRRLKGYLRDEQKALAHSLHWESRIGDARGS